MKFLVATVSDRLRLKKLLERSHQAVRKIGRLAVVRIVAAATRAWVRDRAPTMGAAIAYYTIFSLAPMLWLVTAIVGLAFGEAAAHGAVTQELKYMIGEDAARALESMIQSTSASSSSLVGAAISLLTLIAAATGVLRELQTSFDVIWGVRSRADPVSSTIRQFLLCFAVIAALGLLFIMSLALSAAIAAANAAFGAGAAGETPMLLRLLNALVSLAAMTVVLAVTFKLFPNADVRWSEVWLGAGITSMLLELGKYAIGLYVVSITGRSFYKAAGAIVILLIWAYYSSQILLFGAELTKAIADRRKRRRGRRPQRG